MCEIAKCPLCGEEVPRIRYGGILGKEIVAYSHCGAEFKTSAHWNKYAAAMGLAKAEAALNMPHGSYVDESDIMRDVRVAQNRVLELFRGIPKMTSNEDSEKIRALTSELAIAETKIKQQAAELRKWKTMRGPDELNQMRLQAEGGGLAAKQAYINALEHTIAHTLIGNRVALGELKEEHNNQEGV